MSPVTAASLTVAQPPVGITIGPNTMDFNEIQQPQHKNYQVKCVRGLSITLLICGSLCFLAQFIDIFLKNHASIAGTGIWSGIMTMIAGALGIVSTRKRTTSLIVAFLVMSIIAAVLCVAPLTAGSFGTAFGFYSHNYRGYYYRDRIDPAKMRASVAMNALMIITAVVNGIVLIISAAFACDGLCRDRATTNVVMAGQVQYTTGADGRQQMVILPVNQPVPGGSQLSASDAPTMTTLMPGQQVVITNPTGVGQNVYIHPGHVPASAPPSMTEPPAYSRQGSLPEYQEKQPPE